MNHEQQRIKIAEACGWKIPESCKKSGCLEHGLLPEPKGIVVTAPIPDYLNDLNAMHEAEKHLTKDQCYLYYRILFDSDGTYGRVLHTHHWHLIRATAAQRAEAFLRTLGLWEESK